MYERSTDDTTNAIRNIHAQITKFHPSTAEVGPHSLGQPGDLFCALLGNKATSSLTDDVFTFERSSRNKIDDWAAKHGIEYEPVSELASFGLGLCVGVLGSQDTDAVGTHGKRRTDPRSFEEWTTDFTASFDHAHDHIPGFDIVHRGFKERILPTKAGSGQRKPWTPIMGAIKIVSEGLSKDQAPGTKINVWREYSAHMLGRLSTAVNITSYRFTGHSLGTALATLAYSKALISSNDLSENVILRDAYLFATPITVDMATRHHFDDKMFAKDSDVPRTMWRMANRNDFVATGLPACGDNDKKAFSENNLFGFSHLEIDIFMMNGSHASEKEVIAQRDFAEKDNWKLLKIFYAMQLIALVGRFVAHATVNYYDQLDRIALLPCVDRG
ncbi:hypothetical protein M407DRAFT_33618 [Tulasnella calospora MUT 4182]|uniref:Fungal lipase-type domain-containing protein n=1 Tax=Tulasnella calospora MUT 4182 TaxID=1051891 RepID=A0A0C3K5Q7_9AGAM|nr:hypothetical protein M407DRAFT_33618 [Tulasnella calospora MUT 4182]